MNERLFIEVRNSEDMSVAQRRSLARAVNESVPIHSLQLLLKPWMLRVWKLEAKRNAPASRAMLIEVRFAPGMMSERASIGMKYVRMDGILDPDDEI
jgi:hypothetical protein